MRKSKRAIIPPTTSEQIRAARALLRWSQQDLADASSVSLPTIKRLEITPGRLTAHPPTIAALRRAFEAAGVELIDDRGVSINTG